MDKWIVYEWTVLYFNNNHYTHYWKINIFLKYFPRRYLIRCDRAVRPVIIKFEHKNNWSKSGPISSLFWLRSQQEQVQKYYFYSRLKTNNEQLWQTNQKSRYYEFPFLISTQKLKNCGRKCKHIIHMQAHFKTLLLILFHCSIFE